MQNATLFTVLEAEKVFYLSHWFVIKARQDVIGQFISDHRSLCCLPSNPVQTGFFSSALIKLKYLFTIVIQYLMEVQFL